jgi:DNA invertase Pin-like site-specific DNA recombinase
MSRIPKRKANKTLESKSIAVGYARVSTEEQADAGVSLRQQEEAIRVYGESRGLLLEWGGSGNTVNELAILTERGVSGSVPLDKRPEGRKLAAMARSGKIGHVIVAKLDRLSRSTADSAAWMAEFDRLGVSLHLLDLGGEAVDTSTTSGRLVVNVLSSVAEMVRDTIRDNTRNGMRNKKKHGEYCGGWVPYGLRIVDAKADPIMVEVEPKEQAIIQRARELRRAGLSLRRVGAALTAEGLRPRNGGPWASESIRQLVYEEVNDGR